MRVLYIRIGSSNILLTNKHKCDTFIDVNTKTNKKMKTKRNGPIRIDEMYGVHHTDSPMPTKLEENARRYEELTWTDLDPETLEKTRQILLNIPLIHRTPNQRFSGDAPEERTLYDTPVPADHLDGISGIENNTYMLDQQLGLDRYVFMGWGSAQEEERFGFLGSAKNAILIDSKLLFDPKCVVTPKDVAEHVGWRTFGKGTKAGFFRPQKTMDEACAIFEYRGTMVSGADWFEIVARRITRSVMDGKPMRVGLSDLGEIKFDGPIPSSAVLGTVRTDTEDYDQYERYIEELTGGSLDLIERRKSLAYGLGKLVGKIAA